MKPDPLHPQWFTFKPKKPLDDKSYASPRLTPKSNALKEIEAKQREISGEKLPDNVATIAHASQR